MGLASATALTVPELGPSLGVLVRPAGTSGRQERRPGLDAPRLALVGTLIELAGDARRWSQTGDRQAAVSAIDAEAWRTAWETALHQASAIMIEGVEAELTAAAGESRLPRRLRERLKLTPPERLALNAHLGAGATVLMDALEVLERCAVPLGRPRAPAESRGAWTEALLAAARKTETAWRAVEEAADREWKEWGTVIQRVRAWRRPRRLLWAITAAVFLAAAALGLVLGGYLPVPHWLRPLADWWWAR